jgi:glycosyltransferase involved in cell wall biosynthesis
MRKVCLLTSVHQAFDTRIFYKEARSLAETGYAVTVIGQHDVNEIVEGVQIIGLPRPRNRLQRMVGLTWRVFWLGLRERADIYHCHDPELLLVGILLRLLTRRRLVYDVHEDVPQQILTKDWIPRLVRRLVALLFDPLEKFLARACDGVIVATEGIASRFRRLNPVVVHNFPDVGIPVDAGRVENGGKDRVLVYAGAIGRLRGAFEMIRALEYLEDVDGVRLDLIGSFESPELERALAVLPGYRRVRYLGWLRPPEVWKRLREADIGLVCLHPVPRYVISWPTKLFEYMAAGLPVVASRFPLWKEIVEGSGCGLVVNPLNPEEIAQAIKRLLEDSELRRKMGQKGRETVLRRYNWHNEAKKLLRLYEEAL